ncbi:MAG: dTMP kinase [Candidatus Dependentiae bacterium]|nr:dTMP kinase [Candidatus Dependentiae bacterium]
MIKQGFLLTLEGIDGSGKSTLASNLFEALKQKGLPVLLTKEPGSTPLGKQLRTLVQEKQVPITAKAEYLLFAADRAQHFEDVIIPALRNKQLVISDRMADSSLVYQGYGRGLDRETIAMINAWSMNGITPNLTLFVDIPLEVSLLRLKKRNEQLTSFEKESTEFTKRLIAGFKEIFSTRDNVITLDGQESPEQLAQKALDGVMQWLMQHNIL